MLENDFKGKGDVGMRAKDQTAERKKPAKEPGWLARWIERFRRRNGKSTRRGKASPNIYPLH